MLVQFRKEFVMEGENSITVKKRLWSKPEDKRQKIYWNAVAYGICDESEVDAEIEKQIKANLKRDGWGKDFSGWQRVLTFQECCQLAIEGRLKHCHIPTPEPIIESIGHWTVERAAKKLNGRQFAQYCRDYGITI